MRGLKVKTFSNKGLMELFVEKNEIHSILFVEGQWNVFYKPIETDCGKKVEIEIDGSKLSNTFYPEYDFPPLSAPKVPGDTENDKERWIKFLNEFEIQFTKEENKIILEKGFRKVSGYDGFCTIINFDEKDGFINIGAWE